MSCALRCVGVFGLIFLAPPVFAKRPNISPAHSIGAIGRSPSPAAISPAHHYYNSQRFNYHWEDGLTPPQEPALIQAIESRAEKQVAQLLLEKADPNTKNRGGVPALCRAVGLKARAIVEQLLNAGAQIDVDCRENAAVSPLAIAASTGDLELVKILLEKGSTIDFGDKTALMRASQGGHYAIVQLLLQKGADPNRIAPSGQSSLVEAYRQFYYSVAELLLECRLLTDESVKPVRELAYHRRDRKMIALIYDRELRKAQYEKQAEK